MKKHQIKKSIVSALTIISIVPINGLYFNKVNASTHSYSSSMTSSSSDTTKGINNPTSTENFNLSYRYMDGTTVHGGINYTDSILTTGNGNDTITFSEKVANAVTINTNGGNDTINIDQQLRDSAIVNLGDGDDTITIGDEKYSASINTGNGNDNVTIGNIENAQLNVSNGNNNIKIKWDILDGASILSLDGDNKIEIGNINNSSIRLGTGTNIINVNYSIENNASITVGNGNDTINIDTIKNSSLITNGGNDTVTVERIDGGSAEINTGDGNDIVNLNDVSGSYDTGKIELGNGDDTLEIDDSLYSTDSIFDGGEGKDTLILNNITESDWNSGIKNKFINFENILFKAQEINYSGNSELNVCYSWGKGYSMDGKRLNYTENCDNTCFTPFYDLKTGDNYLNSINKSNSEYGIYHLCSENKENIIKEYCSKIEHDIINVASSCDWYDISCYFSDIEDNVTDSDKNNFLGNDTNYNFNTIQEDSTENFADSNITFFNNHCTDLTKTTNICEDGVNKEIKSIGLFDYLKLHKTAKVGNCESLSTSGISTGNYIEINPDSKKGDLLLTDTCNNFLEGRKNITFNIDILFDPNFEFKAYDGTEHNIPLVNYLTSDTSNDNSFRIEIHRSKSNTSKAYFIINKGSVHETETSSFSPEIIFDGKKHNIIVEIYNGTVTVKLDGTVISTAATLDGGDFPIPGKGMLIFGQEMDTRGSSFDMYNEYISAKIYSIKFFPTPTSNIALASWDMNDFNGYETTDSNGNKLVRLNIKSDDDSILYKEEELCLDTGYSNSDLSKDTDGDSIPDYIDPDTDGDGILDPIKPIGDQDLDGISDSIEGTGDQDGDGTPNYLDTDSDGDGIPDSVEGTGDQDSDGTSNYLDTDSDGDNISDHDEYVIADNIDADNNSNPNYLDTDSDGDSIPDSVEGTGDQDSDGIPNYLDTDSDDDGISDSIEGTGDQDGDGTPNYLDTDSDDDGIPDSLEGNGDQDSDGTPNYLDTDSDNDGISDSIEDTGDQDSDGTPNYLDTDSDGDGIPDNIENTDDTDSDGIANYLDTDSDGDGVSDISEGGDTDSDGDGIPDYLDEDADGSSDNNSSEDNSTSEDDSTTEESTQEEKTQSTGFIKKNLQSCKVDGNKLILQFSHTYNIIK